MIWIKHLKSFVLKRENKTKYYNNLIINYCIFSRFLKQTLKSRCSQRFLRFVLGPNNDGGGSHMAHITLPTCQPVLVSPWCSAAWCLATLVELGKNLKQTSHWTRVLSCLVWLANTSGWLVLLWYHRPESCYGNRERHTHKLHNPLLTPDCHHRAVLLSHLLLPGKTCCRGHSWRAWLHCAWPCVFPAGRCWWTPCCRWDTCGTLLGGSPGCAADAPPTRRNWDNTSDSHEALTCLSRNARKHKHVVSVTFFTFNIFYSHQLCVTLPSYICIACIILLLLSYIILTTHFFAVLVCTGL